MLTKTGNYDSDEPVFAHVTLHNLIKIEDWFKDSTTIVKTLRKGKGRNPFVDSTVKMRIQILANGQEIVSNYPVNEEIKAPYDFETGENLRCLSADEKKAYLLKVDQEVLTTRLDSYELPSLIMKVLKTMKKNGVTQVSTTRIDKLRTNFANSDLKFD